MLDLDVMKQKWAEQDAKLDQSIRLNRALLSVAKLNRTRPALSRMAVSLGLQTAIWIAIVIALGGFIYAHLATPRLALAGAAVDLYAIGMLVAALRQIALIGAVNYEQPIVGIQKQIEAIRVLRIRATQWGVLAGVLVWAPCAMVVFDAAWGLDIFSLAWFWANVAFGLALIPAAVWAARKFANRMQGSPFMQALMRDIAGRSLTDAEAFLARLAEFEAND